jgi:protein ImuA
MRPSTQHRLIDDLKSRIRALDGSGMRERAVLPFAVAAMDAHLPGGGLPRAALHEVAGTQDDLSHGAAAALFVGAVAARLGQPVLWVMKHRDLFAPGLAQVGLHPDRVIYAETGDSRTLLLAMEEGLKHGGLSAVVGELDRLTLTASRRLQLAAEKSGVLAFALRRWRSGEADEATAAVTSWRVEVLPSTPLATPNIGQDHWKLDLMRCRNAERASWIVEAADAQGHLAVPSEPSHGQAASRPGRRRRAA